ncbi:MAG TPA: hypothetical protein VN154_05110 [Rhizomicrobium sp.]|nr:hypothetical protein [Rhizomicrobium sp.]
MLLELISWPPFITVMLALATAATGARGASLWLKASMISYEKTPPPNIPEHQIRRMTEDGEMSAWLNARAAWWTALTAFLGAITTVWSTFAAVMSAATGH